ncbi:acetyl-CoA C-acetyltransferase [Limibacter armeniacum]|uniref:acetyl-CoA C-acetyltransferase n=1 Tax=Limibacter armeniacum TaxID=466084 RepID=UPI002FE64357
MTDAFIFDAVRTPRGKGKKDGALHNIKASHLLANTLTALRDRNNLDTSYVEDAIIGCVTQVKEQSGDIAKVGLMTAGFDENVAGVTVNRFCGSGLEAINQAAVYVMAGQTDLMIAGGVESMSRVPMGSDGSALLYDPEMVMDSYIVPQGISADLIATKYGYSRKDLDIFATTSHQRADAAWKDGRFHKSIVPVKDINGDLILDHDEMVRPNTSPEILGQLNPSFEIMGQMGGFDGIALQRYPEIEQIKHLHHAGNSSGIVDGAAVTLIGNKMIADKLNLKPRARIRSVAIVGTEPTIMLVGPAPSAKKALRKAGMEISDIDLFEVNEAFAAVPIRFMEDLNISHHQVNVNGGAIAMGHPLGATGAMLLGTLLDELERQGKATGMATLCIGGGMGIATIIELV